MRTNLVILLLIIGLSLAAANMFYGRAPSSSSPQEYSAPTQSRKPSFPAAPSFHITDTRTGAAHDLADFKGCTILLNFWASWCLPCRTEFPVLLDYAARNKNHVVFIALSADGNKSAIAPFLKRLDTISRRNLENKNIIIAHDSGKKISQGMFQTYKLPETIIIGPDLTLRRKIIGAEWSPDETEELRAQVDTSGNDCHFLK